MPPVRPQLPPGSRNYITKEGAEQLQQRLTELQNKRATADNEAEQRLLDAFLRKLRATLDTVVVAEIPVDQTKVAFGACVTVRREDGEQQYQIVGVDEAEPAADRISWISPLARVLLSRKAGDRVRFNAPAGEEELLILNVHY